MKAWIFSMGANHPKKIAALLLSMTLAGVLQAMPAPTSPTPANTPATASTITPAVASTQSAAKPAVKARTAPPKSEWSKLSAAQQQALAPLAGDWARLDAFRKEKWLELANRFASMSPEEQARMQERMRDWVKLSPEQRRLARESYTRVKKLDAQQRSKQWEQYQQLPEEKKQALAATVAPKKQIVNPPRQHTGQGSLQAKNAITPSVSAKQPPPTAEVIQPSAPLSSSTP
jgi:hypothetical protein